MSREDLTPAELQAVAALAEESVAFILRVKAHAADVGVTLSLGQVIGAVLGASLAVVDRPMTRAEFMTVYDVFEQQLPGIMRDFGTGPEATADAESSTQAREMREHWGEVISTAAFDLSYSPEGLADWEADLLSGKIPTVGESEPTDG